MNNGTRMRCENCKYGHVERDSRQKPIRAYCQKINIKIDDKRFNQMNSCLYFERRTI